MLEELSAILQLPKIGSCLVGQFWGLTQPVHPHLFRHQRLRTSPHRVLSDAQIQLISGHESKKSLEIYQHLSLGAVEQAYQEAVQSVSI
jgi:integrase/recombinase XerD